MCRHRARHAVFKRRVAANSTDNAFSRRRHQERRARHANFIQVRDEREVFFVRLAETDTGVEAQTIFIYAVLFRFRRFLLKKRTNTRQNIAARAVQVIRVAGVHHDAAAVCVFHRAPHFRCKTRHVVNDMCAGFKGFFRNLGVKRVDGNSKVRLHRNCLHHVFNACPFFFGRNAHAARAGGLPADVHNVHALRFHLYRVAHRFFGVKILAAVRKRIRRHVQNAHHIGSVQRKAFSRCVKFRHIGLLTLQAAA